MAKKFILFSLRLLLLNVVAVIVVAIFLGIANNIVQICIDALFAFVLWYFIWRDALNAGLKDAQKDKIIAKRVEAENYVPQGDEGRMFKPWFGFLTGLAAQTPTLILVVILATIDPGSTLYGILKPVTLFWNYNYLYIGSAMPEALFPYFYILPSLLFCLVSGLAYLNGPRELKRIETIIERNVAKGARRVQDEWKAEKRRKGAQKRQGNRR
jgi:hypothetical protein